MTMEKEQDNVSTAAAVQRVHRYRIDYLMKNPYIDSRLVLYFTISVMLIICLVYDIFPSFALIPKFWEYREYHSYMFWIGLLVHITYFIIRFTFLFMMLIDQFQTRTNLSVTLDWLLTYGYIIQGFQFILDCLFVCKETDFIHQCVSLRSGVIPYSWLFDAALAMPLSNVVYGIPFPHYHILHGFRALALLFSAFDYVPDAQQADFFLYSSFMAFASNVTVIFIRIREKERDEANMQVLKEFEMRASLIHKSKIQYLAQISHDLRGPLQAFQSVLDTLSYFVSTNTEAMDIISAGQAACRLQELVVINSQRVLYSDLREIDKKIDNGSSPSSSNEQCALNQSLILRRLDVEELVSECLTVLKWYPWSAEDTSFSYHVEENAKFIYVDQSLLATTMLNLLTNAKKFTQQGSVRVEVQLSPSSQDFIEISVTDTGKGIPDHLVNDLFKPYKQLQTDKGGLGIGLFSAKANVLAMKGEISYRKNKNAPTGSVFYFSIPIDPRQKFTKTTVVDDSSAPSSPSLKEKLSSMKHFSNDKQRLESLSICLVDDDMMVRKLLAKQFERLNITVTSFEGANLAIHDIANNPNRFDLIISDHDMPSHTGLDFVKQVRNAETCLNQQVPTKGTKFIILTGSFLPRDILDEYNSFGVERILLKPVSVETILEAFYS